MKYKKIRIESYKRSTKSKKRYLARKKLINRHLKYVKKIYKNSKGFKKTYYFKRIESWKEELEMLNIMYAYYKHKNKKYTE